MKIQSVEKDVPFAPIPNTRTWIFDDQLPPKELISSVFALIFDDQGQILLIRNKRGWGPPGGHVEKGESLEAAIIREVQEESDCEIEIVKPFGYQQIEALGEKPSDYQYPYPRGYIQYYFAKLKKMNEFDATSVWRDEVTERGLFSSEEAAQTSSFKENLKYYQEAVLLYNSLDIVKT